MKGESGVVTMLKDVDRIEMEEDAGDGYGDNNTSSIGAFVMTEMVGMGGSSKFRSVSDNSTLLRSIYRHTHTSIWVPSHWYWQYMHNIQNFQLQHVERDFDTKIRTF